MCGCAKFSYHRPCQLQSTRQSQTVNAIEGHSKGELAPTTSFISCAIYLLHAQEVSCKIRCHAGRLINLLASQCLLCGHAACLLPFYLLRSLIFDIYSSEIFADISPLTLISIAKYCRGWSERCGLGFFSLQSARSRCLMVDKGRRSLRRI